jgi:hypothetical protein
MVKDGTIVPSVSKSTHHTFQRKSALKMPDLGLPEGFCGRLFLCEKALEFRARWLHEWARWL